VACSLQENYTDRSTAAFRLLRVEGVTLSAQRIPTAVILSFLDRSRYFVEKAPQLPSRDLVDPVSDLLLLLRKTGSAGNRNRDLWICRQELTTRPQRQAQLNFGHVCLILDFYLL
jgi:hypothetical protein